ncbi:MAG: hypothetical protein Tsb0021_16700 [Chlamydiales bacterium]
MDERFVIYTDRLRDGKEEVIQETFDPAFLELNEGNVSFEHPVEVRGKAYLAQNDLILHLSVDTRVSVRCIICDQKVAVPIEIRDLYIDVPLDDVKGGTYSFQEDLRQEIVVEVPEYYECHEGNCPERKEIEPFLKDPQKNEGEDERQKPFADLF